MLATLLLGTLVIMALLAVNCGHEEASGTPTPPAPTLTAEPDAEIRTSVEEYLNALIHADLPALYSFQSERARKGCGSLGDFQQYLGLARQVGMYRDYAGTEGRITSVKLRGDRAVVEVRLERRGVVVFGITSKSNKSSQTQWVKEGDLWRLDGQSCVFIILEPVKP